MRFAFTDDQQLFRTGLRELLDDQCTAEVVRRAWASEHGRSDDLWSQLAGMGIAGLTVPEEHGGLGLGEVDLVLLMEEAGRAALPEPLLETTAVAAPLLAEAGGEVAQAWLPRIASGEVVLSAALGPQTDAGYGSSADLLVLADGDAVHAVAADEVELVDEPSIDGGRRLARVSWSPGDTTRILDGDAARAAIGRAVDRGALMVAAQAIGVGDRLIAMAADYAQQREQFGKPIGAFQAVKHLLADALVELSFARPVVYRAADSVARDVADRSRDVSMAKVAACEAATGAARAALQVHGAIGYTEEHDLHLWLKRAWGLAVSWGDVRWHVRRVSAAVL